MDATTRRDYPRLMHRIDPKDRRYTAEEYARMPECLDGRDELVRGRVVRKAFPRPIHGRIQARLAGMLGGRDWSG